MPKTSSNKQITVQEYERSQQQDLFQKDDNVHHLLEKANRCKLNHDYKSALTHIDNALIGEPNNPAILNELVELGYKLNRAEVAYRGLFGLTFNLQTGADGRI